MKANGVSLAVSILLGATEKGQPSLLSTSCAFKAGDISVKFKGGARLRLCCSLISFHVLVIAGC